MFERLRDVKYKMDISAELIKLLVDKVTIHHDKSIVVDLKFCDEFAGCLDIPYTEGARLCVNM